MSLMHHLTLLRHITDGQWKDWDPSNPPTQHVELAGGESQNLERPDQWIMPDKYASR